MGHRRKASALRRSASCSGRSRASTSSLTILARRTSAIRLRELPERCRRCARIASLQAFLPTEATSRPTRRSPSSSAAMTNWIRRHRRAGFWAASIARRSSRASRLRPTGTGSRSMARSSRSMPSSRVTQCVVNNDPAACALVTRSAGGQLTQVPGLLGNIAGIETKGMDLNMLYRTAKTGFGSFRLHLEQHVAPRLRRDRADRDRRNGDPPRRNGAGQSRRRASRSGSRSASSIGTWRNFRRDADRPLRLEASGSGRQRDEVACSTPTSRPGSRHPSGTSGFGFAVGVNNVFDTKIPGCVTCDLNNFDPTVYDVPGRYYYARVSVKLGDRKRAPAYTPPPSPPAGTPPPPPPPAAEPAPPPPPPPPPPAPERG